MVKKNSNLDHFVMEKLSGYEAPEKKGNWQLLNHLLEVRKRRRKIIRRILFLSSFLAVLLISFLIFIPGNEKSKNAGGDDKNHRSVISSPPVADSNDNTNEVADSYARDTSGKNDDKHVAADDAKKITREDTFAENAKINTKITAIGKSKVRREEIADSKEEKHSSTPDADFNLAKRTGIDSADADPQSKEEQTKKNDVASDLEVEKRGEEDTKIVEATVEDAEKAEYKDSAIHDSTVAETAIKDSTVAESLATEVVAKDSLNRPAEDTVKLKDRNANGFSFNLLAGLNLYRTQSLTFREERNVSALVGLELRHPFSRHFEAGLGALYSLQGGYHLSDTSMQVSYFLEKNVSQQTILIRKQHKLYVPLTLYYIISDKHSVSGGIHWSYLINTVGDYTEMKSISGSTSQSQKDDVKGYMDGITSSAFSFSVGYRFSLSKRFDVHTRFIQELSDSYTPQYFYGVNTSPSWLLQIFLSVKF